MRAGIAPDFKPLTGSYRARLDVERLRRDPEVATMVFTMQAANVNRLSGLERTLVETRERLDALRAEPLLRGRVGPRPALTPTP